MSDPVASGRSKLELLKEAAPELVRGLTNDDRVGLWKFSVNLDAGRDYQELVPVGPLGEALPGGTRSVMLASAVENLRARGGTGLFDTTLAAVSTMTKAATDPNKIHKEINAVVLLTDGMNDDLPGGIPDVDALLSQLPGAASGQPPVRVFTVAYGSEAGQAPLIKIADHTRGGHYDAKDPTTIKKVLIDVISNF